MTDAEQAKEDAALLKRIDEEGEDVTEWECDFIESCLRRLDTGLPLTPEQRKKAEQIEQERCS